jgi:hypothetical protein
MVVLLVALGGAAAVSAALAWALLIDPAKVAGAVNEGGISSLLPVALDVMREVWRRLQPFS